MDPHLRVVYEWDQDNIPTERDAYNLARIKGYIFDEINQDGIGDFSSSELTKIASHPPNINYSRYKKYRTKTLSELKTLFPEITEIIGEKVTYEDLFYYATRGWIPQYDSLEDKINRLKRYNDLSDIGKSLMETLYGSKERFLNGISEKKDAKKYEKHIIAFDHNIDNLPAIRSIGESLGFDEPIDAPEDFYEIFSDWIRFIN